MSGITQLSGQALDLYGNTIPMAACPNCSRVSQRYVTGDSLSPKEQWGCSNSECPVANFDARGRVLFRKRRQAP
ncbi:MAG: hypothetical protein JRN62_03190 [Nitrososphaerota archaeon]|nr:hypothetical protein [Nitrososphaerota archaeon]MDG6948602.1 hypothetical protein [Nitrososphaerota archaeon]